jgi:predicted ATPase
MLRRVWCGLRLIKVKVHLYPAGAEEHVMLTRLKVSGFKNLVDVDVRFGPFTCIAGVNGVGKSNLFDAIHFLGVLADRPLLEAAKSVRDERGQTTDVRSLFHRVGEVNDSQMTFEAEMIIPAEGADDLGQSARASTTFVKYVLVLGFRSEEGPAGPGGLELVREELSPIKIGDAPKTLLFDHSKKWRDSAVSGKRNNPFISTDKEGSNRIIKLHQDNQNSKGGGRAIERSAPKLPRTVLSSVTAAESPTALLVRREMQSWHLLQLEPSALRKPDEFSNPTRLGMDGAHLPATLNRLAAQAKRNNGSAEGSDVYNRVANRLADLIEDVRDVQVDRDEKRELYTVHVRAKDGTIHPAKALSDGTLRFLALAVLELDPETQGLLCLEEPENGIHPHRIRAMLNLLQDIAVDTQEAVGPDNPLRQVIVNTHSPVVVAEVPDDSLLLAQLKDTVSSGKHFESVRFSCLPKTWRVDNAAAGEEAHAVSRGEVIRFLSPISRGLEDTPSWERRAVRRETGPGVRRTRRVVDRPDMAEWLFSVERSLK